MISDQKIDTLIARFEAIAAKMAQGGDAATLGEAVAKASAVTESDINQPEPDALAS